MAGATDGRDVVLPKAGERYVGQDGTVSQVLEDHVDSNYEPTEDEVLELAKWMGMSLPADKNFLWIAREGLKTPLPAEWKPCRTDDGEVYYFNFRTGESSWDHPLDDVFRKKFEAEKAKARMTTKPQRGDKDGMITSPPATGKAVAPLPQTSHVLFTDAGVLRHDGSSSLFSLPPTPRGAANAATGVAVAPRAVPLGHSAGSTELATSETASLPPSTSGSPAAASPTRLLSEAEQALEERVRAEVAEAFAEAQRKANTLHTSKMESLRRLHTTEVEAMRAASASSRREAAEAFEREKKARMEAVRRRCEDVWQSQLITLESEAAELRQRLKTATEECSRLKASKPAVDEVKAAAELAQQLEMVEKKLQVEFEEQQRAMAAAHERARSALEGQLQDEVRRVQEEERERARALRGDEAAAVEARKAKLLSEEAALDQALQAATAGSQGGSASSSPASPSAAATAAAVQDIKRQGDATCDEIKKRAAEEQASFSREQDKILAQLRQQVVLAEGPVAVTLNPRGTASKNASTSSNTVDAAGLTALRERYAAKKQSVLAALKSERERRLAEVQERRSDGSAATVVASGPHDSSSTQSSLLALQEVQRAHAEALQRASALYKAQEEAAAANYTAELAVATSTTTEQAINRAIEADMAVYVSDMETRRERLRREHAEKAALVEANHRVQLEQYQKKMAEQEAHRAADAHEARAALLEEAIEAAVAKERESLAQAAATARARKMSNYEDELSATRAEVDEEMDAYVLAERQKMRSEAAAAPPTVHTRRVDVGVQHGSLISAPPAQTEVLQQLHAELRAAEAEEAAYRARQPSSARGNSGTPNTTTRTSATTAVAASPHDRVRAEHREAMASLEREYQRQEQELQDELTQLERATAAVDTPKLISQKTSAPAALKVKQTTPAAAPGDADGWAGANVSGVDDARQYWLLEQENMKARQRELARVRDEWRQQYSAAQAAQFAAVVDSLSERLARLSSVMESSVDRPAQRALRAAERERSREGHGVAPRVDEATLARKWGSLLDETK